jgi:polar amino acid transport system permease protein
VWYLVITSFLSAIQYLVERALAKSERRSAVNSNRSRASVSTATPTPEAAHAQLS